jgi:hypothetical protein
MDVSVVDSEFVRNAAVLESLVRGVDVSGALRAEKDGRLCSTVKWGAD